jgi:hypothetical protein
MTQRHHLHSRSRRSLYAAAIVLLVMGAGTAGMRLLERLTWLDAFYFMSMIATCQGPAFTPATAAGKLFASAMAFLSVGMVVTTLGFLFGPFLGRLFHIGRIKLQEEIDILDRRKGGKK